MITPKSHTKMQNAILAHLESMCDTPTNLNIIRTETINGDAIFVLFAFDGDKQAAVYYPADDVLMTPTDWQSGYPHTPAELTDYDWHSSTGDEAIIVDGLPRLFAAYRDDFRKRVGAKIRRIREEQGLSQLEVASRAGLPQSHITRLESGSAGMTLDTLARLSNALGVELI